MNFCWPAHGLWACVDRQALWGFHTSMCAKLPPSSLIFAGPRGGWRKDDKKKPSHIMATHLSACLASTPIHALSTAKWQLMAREHLKRLTRDWEKIYRIYILTYWFTHTCTLYRCTYAFVYIIYKLSCLFAALYYLEYLNILLLYPNKMTTILMETHGYKAQ